MSPDNPLLGEIRADQIWDGVNWVQHHPSDAGTLPPAPPQATVDDIIRLLRELSDRIKKLEDK